MSARALRILATSGLAAAACATAPGSGGPRAASPAGASGAAATEPPAAPREPSSDEKLAAIQKAMNELDEAAQQCWAVAATERFDIAGEVALQVEIAAPSAIATVVRDTARNPRLTACLVQLLAAYRWAPPLHGQAIQLPFRFRAPDSQNTIDRALVAWSGQGKVSVAVLLDAANTGSDAASLFELAIAAGGTTGLRRADRAELWFFLGAGQVAWPGGGSRAVAAGDVLHVPRGASREVSASAADLHAVIAVSPGGREGAARGGALPTPDPSAGAGDRGAAGGGGLPAPAAGARGAPPAGGADRGDADGRAPAGRKPAAGGGTGRGASAEPRLVPAASVPVGGGAPSSARAMPDRAFAAAILALPAGGALAEHVHDGEAELLYILAGGGALTVNGVELPVTPTSVVQIPRYTRHAFAAKTEVRAVQIFIPAGPAP